ncbi:MAG: hypothetical protein J6Y01_08380 [Spirochaetales bacterium]|nr:hypothetical protein [Spirochaetales bacterium]
MKKILFILVTFVLLLSCTKKETNLDLSDHVFENVIDNDIYLRSISYRVIDDILRIVYCDERTQSLKYAAFTEKECNISYIDKVDTSEKHNANMGVHGYEAVGGREYLVYEEYKSEKKNYFKAINRRFDKPSWTVDILGVNPSEFVTFSDDGNLFIMYTDDRLITKQYDGGLASVRMSEDIRGLINPRLYKNDNNDTFYLYGIENNILSQRTMHITKQDGCRIDTTESVGIGENIKAYSVCLNSDNRPYLIYFNETDRTMTISDPNEEKPQLLGYFNTVYALDSIMTDGNIYFVVSSIVPQETEPLTFQMTLIYRDNSGVWQEGTLCQTESPVYQVRLAEYHGQLYVIYGINSLILAKVERE